MTTTANEYGCVQCQTYHSESDGPVYVDHLMRQSKHGLRRRVIPVTEATSITEIGWENLGHGDAPTSASW